MKTHQTVMLTIHTEGWRVYAAILGMAWYAILWIIVVLWNRQPHILG